MVTFRIAKEEFAFHMEHVREILRVQTPNQVPDVPDYVLGVLTVRGQILPVIDLRRLLQQRSLADEFADNCRPLRRSMSAGSTRPRRSSPAARRQSGRLGHRASPEVARRNQQFQPGTDGGAREGARAERKGHQAASGPDEKRRARDRDAARTCGEEVLSGGRETVAALAGLSSRSPEHSGGQRIIVVDAEGFVLGWWSTTFTRC